MMNIEPVNTRKRKSPPTASHSGTCTFPFDDLNQDLLERVLSWLPPSTFFRLRSVCKRWNSVANSATFHLACSEIKTREPWFLMVGQDLNQSIIFDTSQEKWKKLNHPNFLQQTHSIPVASSGGLVLFQSPAGKFVISNPTTGSCREIPSFDIQVSESQTTLHAIAMTCSSKNLSSYRIVLVFGEFPNLSVLIFNSDRNQWEEEFMLKNSSESDDIGGDDEPDTMYFLTKSGEVVATNMQRSPSKQYSSVLIVDKDGEEVVYFLSQSGKVVSCNLTRRTLSEYPSLLPIFFEYSIDVVECNGEMMVVLLSDFLESASVRVWKFSKENKGWHQVASMPPWMSHEFFDKKADINCVGCGDSFLICLSSCESCRYVMCNLEGNEWVELPKCIMNGRDTEFMSAFTFEPRVEIYV